MIDAKSRETIGRAFTTTAANVPGVAVQLGMVPDHFLAALVPDEAETAFIAAMDAAGVYVQDVPAGSIQVLDPTRAVGWRVVATRPSFGRFYAPFGTLDNDPGHALSLMAGLDGPTTEA